MIGTHRIFATLAACRRLDTRRYAEPAAVQTAAHNTLSFAAAAVLLTTAVVACYVPARRASSVDPIEALRD